MENSPGSETWPKAGYGKYFLDLVGVLDIVLAVENRQSTEYLFGD